MIPPEYTDAELDAIRERTAREDATQPRAALASYEAAKVCFTLKNGVEIRIPAEIIQGLQGATDEQLSNIRIDGGGYALFWDDIDVQMTVEGLVAGRYGSARWVQGLPDNNGKRNL